MNGSPELFAALARFQSQMQNIHKDKTANTGKFGYRYADIAGVIESIREPLAACGLCYMQVLDEVDGKPALHTILAHEAGGHVSGKLPFSGDLSDPQKFGGITTYYRRYALLGILGLATDDDDAQGVSHSPASARPATQAPTPRASPQFGAAPRPEPSQRVEAEMDWSDLWAKVLRPKGIKSAEQLTALIGDYSPLSAAQVAARVDALGPRPEERLPDEYEVSRPRPQYPASDKQISFIKSLLTKKGMDAKAWPGWAAYALDVDDAPDVDNLSVKQATAVIDQLKEMPDNPGLAAALEASGR
jgi:hypothetical protein